MTEAYIGSFGSREDVAREFNEALPAEAKIILAAYGGAAYEGEAFVLFELGGKLFEVNGSHCSCYGLEDQWSPEEVDRDTLRHRLEAGNLGKIEDANFEGELRAFLAEGVV